MPSIKRRENTAYLPGSELSPQIAATGDLAEMALCEVLLLVTPAQFLRATLQALPDTVCAIGAVREGDRSGFASADGGNRQGRAPR